MKRESRTQKAFRSRIVAKRRRREHVRKIRRREKRLRLARSLIARRVFAIEHNVGYDGRAGRAQIVLPAILSLERNYNETALVINEMRHFALVKRKPVMLHFDHVTDIDPSAALVLVAEIYRLRKLRYRGIVSGTYPKHRAVYDLLSQMGFFGLLEIVEMYGIPEVDNDPDKPIFLKFVTGTQVLAKSIDKFVSVIENNIVPMNDAARQKLVGAIIEAMGNTLEHSAPSARPGTIMAGRWWLSSRVNVSRKEVMVMLFDHGVGVPATVEPTAYERIRAALASLFGLRRLTAQPSDGELIMAATEIFRSRTGKPGRGRGFRDMKQFVDNATDGELRVYSNRGQYAYMGVDKEACSDAELPIGGTVIQWRFRNEGTVDLSDE